PPCSPFLFCCLSPFYFTAPATPEILTLSLHDALPISTSEILGIQVLLHHETGGEHRGQRQRRDVVVVPRRLVSTPLHSRAVQVVDRKSTRLNSSHVSISYAVFCLKKKKQRNKHTNTHT